ncbi:MAG: hypothetical protein KME21_29770 [Desmonostoc vinosum HA7617-LM4]|jgi:hypothetical protein|nr:hypothetical protein [Desmonostoc vinosum HA7617-LM4]
MKPWVYPGWGSIRDWVLGTGDWVLGIGYWVLGTGEFVILDEDAETFGRGETASKGGFPSAGDCVSAALASLRASPEG